MTMISGRVKCISRGTLFRDLDLTIAEEGRADAQTKEKNNADSRFGV